MIQTVRRPAGSTRPFRTICSRAQSSAGLRAIIGLFLLKLTDFIRPALLTLFAPMRAIMKPCLQSSEGNSHGIHSKL
jgi:hypothetical protein